ncbi:hypothetical protein [Rhodococcus chondri]|uniref:Uncharacterized protein n=1 Tax=Rhodococcus chondri TaxID=3065941 RepID=A0ABU7JTJ3_9NOCA|nr:hypothetical protein [Rhodococcus sp. CC-R104]MEE2033348.1 hypothetical protein [Rhodococcus sp. CC-R104]
MLNHAVRGDLVTMYIRATGTKKYQTESKSEITLPTFDLDIIEVTGSGHCHSSSFRNACPLHNRHFQVPATDTE